MYVQSLCAASRAWEEAKHHEMGTVPRSCLPVEDAGVNKSNKQILESWVQVLKVDRNTLIDWFFFRCGMITGTS